MSREKVAKYKEHKANRKEIYAKEKQQKKMRKLAWITAGVVFVGCIAAAIGMTAMNEYKSYVDSKPNYMSAEDMVVEDLAGMLETEAE